jgi:hypothetical protein
VLERRRRRDGQERAVRQRRIGHHRTSAAAGLSPEVEARQRSCRSSRMEAECVPSPMASVPLRRVAGMSAQELGTVLPAGGLLNMSKRPTPFSQEPAQPPTPGPDLPPVQEPPAEEPDLDPTKPVQEPMRDPVPPPNRMTDR